jgi:lipopolysaccharide/colanic/teichoic acid biosynthesis glycosyltransferase
LLKFRTMRGPSRPPSAASNPLDKRAADPRVTRGGAILRRFSLDELPQLVNILRGEMAFVGPRPLPTDESRVEEPWQAMRYRVLPGLTGLWQVTARNRSSFEELCRIDFLAVCARSPRLWMRIFLRTFPEILGGGGR